MGGVGVCSHGCARLDRGLEGGNFEKKKRRTVPITKNKQKRGGKEMETAFFNTAKRNQTSVPISGGEIESTSEQENRGRR